MRRNRAYYKWQRSRIISRKLGILGRMGWTDAITAWTRGQPGRLAKGKIHCSCRMCRRKSYDCLSHVDLKQCVSAKQQLDETNENS